MKLTVQDRSSKTAKQLLKEKQVPVIVYGPTFENKSGVCNYQELYKILKKAQYHNIIELDWAGETIRVLAKSIDQDPIQDTITHVDFYVVTDDRKIEVPVPVEFAGDSEALRIGCILEVASPRVKVSCTAQNIPEKVEADLALLKNKGDNIRIKDLKPIDGVEFTQDKNMMLAKSTTPRAARKLMSEGEETA